MENGMERVFILKGCHLFGLSNRAWLFFLLVRAAAFPWRVVMAALLAVIVMIMVMIVVAPWAVDMTARYRGRQSGRAEQAFFDKIEFFGHDSLLSLSLVQLYRWLTLFKTKGANHD